MSILRLENVNKSYGDEIIIRNMSFDVKEEGITAIIGQSGSGKTTILNMIGLLESIDSGNIILKGTPLPNINSKKATLIRRKDINYLFQSNALVNDASVLQNLLLSMEFVEKSKSKKIDDIKRVLQDLHIEKTLYKKINTLSGGEQQRVAMARCILKPGDIILADEPTGSLDPIMGGVVFEILLKLRREYHKTIIVVTHDIPLAKKCDVVIDITK